MRPLNKLGKTANSTAKNDRRDGTIDNTPEWRVAVYCSTTPRNSPRTDSKGGTAEFNSFCHYDNQVASSLIGDISLRRLRSRVKTSHISGMSVQSSAAHASELFEPRPGYETGNEVEKHRQLEDLGLRKPKAGILSAILVIEDEAPAQAALRAELGRRGFHTDGATTVEASHELLRTNAYDAVTLDLMLPQGPSTKACPPDDGLWPGIQILRKIRRGEYTRFGTSADVPVFVLTCVLDLKTREEVQVLGIKSFWSKPMGLGTVAEHVKLTLMKQ